jgi:hypothetical protein
MQRMDPAGIKFGLSRNLLQLDGTGVIIGADVLDAMSEVARQQTLTGPPKFGKEFPSLLLDEGIRQVLPPRVLEKEVEVEIDLFCRGIARVLDETLRAIAIRAHIGYQFETSFLATEEFMGDLHRSAVKATATAEDADRRFFEIWRATVIVYFARHDPASTKHADLLTLFLLNKWFHPIDSLKKFFLPGK